MFYVVFFLKRRNLVFINTDFSARKILCSFQNMEKRACLALRLFKYVHQQLWFFASEVRAKACKGLIKPCAIKDLMLNFDKSKVQWKAVALQILQPL